MLSAALAAARSARDSFRRQGRAVATARAELVVLAARRRTGARGARARRRRRTAGPPSSRRRGRRTPRRVAARRPGRGRRRAGRRDGAVGGGRPLPPPPLRAGAGHGVARRGTRPGPARRACAGCGTPAAEAWTRSTTTGPRWAAPSCARWPRRAATSWPGWRRPARSHAGPRTQLWWSERWRGRAGPARDPVPARRRAGRSAGRAARQRPPAVRGPGRRRVDQHAGARAGPAGEGHPAPQAPGRRHERHGAGRCRPRRRTGWSTRSATRPSWSCSRSTVGCGRSSSPAAGSGPTPWAAPRTPARRSTRHGSCCGRRRVAGRSGSPTSGLASRQRCSARPSPRFGTGPVVVSPTASLHATPWGLLPALAGVPVTVVPTASAWLRARGSRLAGTAGCSSPVRGWHRGERRSRWWPRSTRTPWC